ncbi:hypothetical protein F511_10677 [Dorcoceras hygrometricum]|uniref:RING-type E3 ubiquitin transferase n=1 Tax=Dorcoceras hygrometricum TaxID=472368 RepID=A0A2Z7CJ83_9LAMI|nr:hypothetical protein F511_10677 [Dorcoceras hygrometricum]
MKPTIVVRVAVFGNVVNPGPVKIICKTKHVVMIPKQGLDVRAFFSDYVTANARSADKSFAQSNIYCASYVGNEVDGRSSNVQSYSSNLRSLNIISNPEYVRESGRHMKLGSGPPHTQCPYSLTDTRHIQILNASASHVGSYVGDSSIYLDNNETSGPRFSTWGISCKRKAIEGTSGQSYHGGSSSSNQRMEDTMNHSVSGCRTDPGDLGVTSGPLNLTQLNHPEKLNPSNGVGINGLSTSYFPSSKKLTSEQGPATNFSVTANLEHRASDPLEPSRGTSSRHYSVHSSSCHRNLSRALNQWNRDGSSSSSSTVFWERGSVADARTSYRTNSKLPMIAPAPETRTNLHDPIDWSLAPGTSTLPRNHSSGSRSVPSSGGPASSRAWLPCLNMASQSSQRFSEVAPWIPFLNIDSDSETQRSHSALFPSASLSAHEPALISRAPHQPDQRLSSFSMNFPGDDTSRRRALATAERRHRLIRQVLNAMPRGVHLQAEDYMINDPFVNGFIESHDRYRDMRLDVDNMSYEELLALEERIGNVTTGLTEEKISSSMEQKIYEAIKVSPNLEPCCICQVRNMSRISLPELILGYWTVVRVSYHLHQTMATTEESLPRL